MIDTARQLNPGIPIIVRAADSDVAKMLEDIGVHKALHAKDALAQVMSEEAVRVARAG
jgi:hypothetical protein